MGEDAPRFCAEIESAISFRLLDVEDEQTGRIVDPDRRMRVVIPILEHFQEIGAQDVVATGDPGLEPLIEFRRAADLAMGWQRRDDRNAAPDVLLGDFWIAKRDARGGEREHSILGAVVAEFEEDRFVAEIPDGHRDGYWLTRFIRRLVGGEGGIDSMAWMLAQLQREAEQRARACRLTRGEPVQAECGIVPAHATARPRLPLPIQHEVVHRSRWTSIRVDADIGGERLIAVVEGLDRAADDFQSDGGTIARRRFVDAVLLGMQSTQHDEVGEYVEDQSNWYGYSRRSAIGDRHNLRPPDLRESEPIPTGSVASGWFPDKSSPNG